MRGVHGGLLQPGRDESTGALALRDGGEVRPQLGPEVGCRRLRGRGRLRRRGRCLRRSSDRLVLVRRSRRCLGRRSGPGTRTDSADRLGVQPPPAHHMVDGAAQRQHLQHSHGRVVGRDADREAVGQVLPATAGQRGQPGQQPVEQQHQVGEPGQQHRGHGGTGGDEAAPDPPSLRARPRAQQVVPLLEAPQCGAHPQAAPEVAVGAVAELVAEQCESLLGGERLPQRQSQRQHHLPSQADPVVRGVVPPVDGYHRSGRGADLGGHAVGEGVQGRRRAAFQNRLPAQRPAAGAELRAEQTADGDQHRTEHPGRPEGLQQQRDAGREQGEGDQVDESGQDQYDEVRAARSGAPSVGAGDDPVEQSLFEPPVEPPVEAVPAGVGRRCLRQRAPLAGRAPFDEARVAGQR